MDPVPWSLDFRAFGERARRVRTAHCELQTVKEERLSKGTGQRHSIGGFTGVAEYEGPVAEFLPYLEAARWTGVGRQTVWGKGEIAAEIMTENIRRLRRDEGNGPVGGASRSAVSRPMRFGCAAGCIFPRANGSRTEW